MSAVRKIKPIETLDPYLKISVTMDEVFESSNPFESILIANDGWIQQLQKAQQIEAIDDEKEKLLILFPLNPGSGTLTF